MIAVERRAAPRFRLEANVELEWGSEILRARVTDISLHGMFVRMDNPLWIGAACRAWVLVADPLTVDIVVRRIVPMEGMGVAFLDLPPEALHRLEALLRKLGG